MNILRPTSPMKTDQQRSTEKSEIVRGVETFEPRVGLPMQGGVIPLRGELYPRSALWYTIMQSWSLLHLQAALRTLTLTRPEE